MSDAQPVSGVSALLGAASPRAMRTTSAFVRDAVWAIDRIGSGVRLDAVEAGLADWWAPVRVMDEVAAELDLAAELLERSADAVETADRLSLRPATAAQWDGLLDGVSRAITAAADTQGVADDLARRIHDGVGATPVDLPAPGQVGDGEGHPTGHFAWIPLWGPDGPSSDDVRQGAVGNCALHAAFAGIADTNPHLVERMFTDHGNGTYTVHFADGDVTVDDELPIGRGDSGTARLTHARTELSPDGALWPAILEKAMAERAGGDHDDLWGERPESAFEALGIPSATVVVNPVFAPDPSDDNVAEQLHRHLDSGSAAVAVSAGVFGMGYVHGWTVSHVQPGGTADATPRAPRSRRDEWADEDDDEDGEDVEEDDETGIDDAATATVTLRNPWGVDGIEPTDDGRVRIVGVDGPVSLDGDGAERIDWGDPGDGIVTMPIDVFTAEFDRVELTQAGDD